MPSEHAIQIKNSNRIKEAAQKLGHKPKYKSGRGFHNKYKCSCGWTGRGLKDYEKIIFEEWLAHARKIIESGQAWLPLKKKKEKRNSRHR